MDPLSLAASIIAVIGAAKATADVIEKLCGYFNAPDLILQLLNEVADFRVVLASVQETIRQLREQSLDVLLKIKRTTEGGLIEKHDGNSKERMKISWKSWLKKHDEVEKFPGILRHVRVDIATTCTVLTASAVPRVHLQLHNISLTHQELSNTVEAQTRITGGQLEKLVTDVASIKKSRENSSDPLRPSAPTSIVRFQTSIDEACSPLCMCRCHHRSRFQSPSWMKVLMGRVFIGYSGSPIFRSRVPCSEKACRRTESNLLVNYYFPTWFFSRMLVLRDRFSPLHGHMISVCTPRVCHPDSTIFIVAIHGTVAAAQKLFAQGLASPYDVDDKGCSALKLAVWYKRPEMCKFLLSQHADPYQVDNCQQSSNDSLLTHGLTTPTDPVVMELMIVLGFDSDAPEGLLSRRFSLTHRIVLGLTKMDLETHLLISTADLESRCSEGRTPLFWAAIRNDMASVMTLLRFGANIQVYDNLSETVLHEKLSAECLATILCAASTRASAYQVGRDIPCHKFDLFNQNQDLGCSNNTRFEEFINHSSTYRLSPLTRAAQTNNSYQARVLLAYGACTDTPNASPALTMAVQVNAHAIVELLLQHGARQDSVDDEGQGVLHLAALRGDLEMMALLSARLCCIDTETLDVFGYTPLQVFDKMRSKYTTEDDATRDRCRRSFLKLISGIIIHPKDHLCWANKVVETVFKEKCHEAETSSIYSAEEYFYDAESVVEDLSNETHSLALSCDSKVKYYD